MPALEDATSSGPDDVTFDPLDAGFVADPFATLAALRRQRAVFWHDQLRAWVVLRHQLARHVLQDHATFAADPRRAGLPLPAEQVSIQSTDPPDQLPVRTELSLAMRRVDLEDVGRRAGARTAAALATTGPRLDAVTDVVEPVVAAVTTELLGLPDHLAPEFADANRAIVRAMMSGLDPAAAEPGQQARVTANRLLTQWMPQARTGLLGAIRESPTAALLDQEHLTGSLRVLLLSSLNSTAAMIGLGMLNLLGRDGAAAAFVGAGDPSVAVHELVRFDGPAQAAGRVCVRDTALAGERVHAGDQVIVMLAAANRDPDRFESPDELRLDRRPNPHLAFGRGVHHCIGTQLALTVGAAVLDAACRSGWRLDPQSPPRFDRNPALRNLSSLPLTRT